MNFKILQRHSLKTRITLLTLGIFLSGIWALVLFANRVLHQDLQLLVEQQQFSAATLVAAEIDQEVGDRLKALETVAAEINPELIASAPGLQKFLSARSIFYGLFNGGTVVTGLDGVVLASAPSPRQGGEVNRMDSDAIANALKNGRLSIGKPRPGPDSTGPVFSMASPILDSHGKVIGSVSGDIRLGAPNFLDRITGNPYGETGGYLVVIKEHRLIVAATDKSRILEVLPQPGVIPLADRFVQGYQGSGVATTPKGVSVLASARGIPSAGWYLVVLLPYAEAFKPIDDIEKRLMLVTGALTLLVAGITWWLVQRQLVPLSTTVQALAAMRSSARFPHPLAIRRDDEIGELITGFNRLLETLQHRDTLLAESEQRFRTLIEWTPEAFAVHRAGKILYFNPAALRLFGASTPQDVVGKPILNFIHPDYRQFVLDRVRRSELEGIDPPPTEEVFLRLDGTPMNVEIQGKSIVYDGERATQVVMRDITQRKRNQLQLERLLAEQKTTLNNDLVGIVRLFARTVQWTNPHFGKLLGYDADHLVGLSTRQFFENEQAYLDFGAAAYPVLGEGGIYRSQVKLVRSDGAHTWFDASGGIPNRESGESLWIFLDITERRHAEQALQASLNEKVALLNEVHHRVKNNLQVISSLLRLEAGRSEHPDTRAMLHDMQGRIRSMGLLHELLYRTGTFASVDLGDYLKKLTTQTFRAQTANNGHVRLQLQLCAVQVSMDQATPCGLMVNELVSNSLKHGFPEGREGEVRVELFALTSDPGTAPGWCLRVSDTGVGLPDDFEARMQQSLGLQLAADLARQIGSSLVIAPGPGANFSVTFTVEVMTSPVRFD